MSHPTTPRPLSRPLTRRSLLAGGLGAGTLLLAACGDGAGTAGAAAGSSTSTSTTAAPTSTDGLPLDPQRVVAMYATDSDFALALGLPLVAAYSTATTGFPAYQAALLDGVTPLLTLPEPSYETIAAARPDLIFHGSLSYYADEQEAPLRKIAPVYSFPADMVDDGASWQDRLLDAAATFERTEAAEEAIAAYDARVATLKQQVQARWSGATFAYIGPMDPGQFYVAQPEMQTNMSLHDDLGLAFSQAVPPSIKERRTDISYEEMELLSDADIILLRTNPRDGSVEVNTEQTAEITGAPLWSTLPAVRAGNAYLISGDLFYQSPVTATANLDWVQENLLKTA